MKALIAFLLINDIFFSLQTSKIKKPSQSQGVAEKDAFGRFLPQDKDGNF